MGTRYLYCFKSNTNVLLYLFNKFHWLGTRVNIFWKDTAKIMSQKQAKRLKSHENSLGSLVIIFCKHTFIMLNKFHWIGSCVKIFWKDTGMMLSQKQATRS